MAIRHTTQRALEQLGRRALREQGTEALLQRVVDLANTMMPGDTETSVSVIVEDRPQTPAFSGKLALDCDESQYGRGHGPCRHAASTGEVTEIADASTETRWPDHLRRAIEFGSLSCRDHCRSPRMSLPR